MAVGTAFPKLLVVAGAMSANLAGASLPAPSTTAFAIPSGPGSGARGALANPSSASAAKVGAFAPVHDLVWFERVHVIPRTASLSLIISEQQIATEVYNAFRARSKTLTAVTITGTAGVSVEDAADVPKEFPPTFSKVYTVRALSAGDPQINDVVTWVFTGITSSGTNLTLTGQRFVPFPFRANMAETIDGGLGYLTGIMRADDWTEQRRQLRKIPMRSIEFSVLLDERDVQHAAALLQGQQGRFFGVPIWPYANPLGANLSIGGSVITVSTVDIPYEVGGVVFLWRDPYTWEALTILSFNATSITTSTPAQKAWIATRDLVMPLRPGYLPAEQPLDWLDLRVGSTRILWELETVA